MSNSTLKLIALITMMIDHIGACLFPDQIVLRLIGRVAFPIYIFLLVEGFQRTKDIKKYILRLLAFAAISEIPFNLAFNGNLLWLDHQNVFFTLALGLIMIWCLDTLEKKPEDPKKPFLKFFIVMAFMFAALALRVDYVACGVAVIFVFYQYRNGDLKQEITKYIMASVIFFVFYGKTEMTCIAAFPLIHFYNGKRGMKLKYVFYVFYPVHLMVLWAVKMAFPAVFS